MAEYPYTTVSGKLKDLLTKIRDVGVPPKANTPWLKSIGFKSGNDATLLGVLKYIGFTDASGVPTSSWTGYRGANYKTLLGDAIRKGYADLFAVYPDANTRSQTDLHHVFSTSSSAGKQVIDRTVSTFRSLVALAEFPPPGEITNLSMEAGRLHVPPTDQKPDLSTNKSSFPVHIDIQIHISPESSPEQIEKIFESMAKHLYGPQKTS